MSLLYVASESIENKLDSALASYNNTLVVTLHCTQLSIARIEDRTGQLQFKPDWRTNSVTWFSIALKEGSRRFSHICDVHCFESLFRRKERKGVRAYIWKRLSPAFAHCSLDQRGSKVYRIRVCVRNGSRRPRRRAAGGSYSRCRAAQGAGWKEKVSLFDLSLCDHLG